MIAVRCAFCHRDVPDELCVSVSLDGTVAIVCPTCLERADEAAGMEDCE